MRLCNCPCARSTGRRFDELDRVIRHCYWASRFEGIVPCTSRCALLGFTSLEPSLGLTGTSRSRRSAIGRPETAGAPDCLPQTSRSDLILNVSKVASISPTWAPATGHNRSFPTRSQVLARSIYERQVSGAKSEAFVGSTRPLPYIQADRESPRQ